MRSEHRVYVGFLVLRNIPIQLQRGVCVIDTESLLRRGTLWRLKNLLKIPSRWLTQSK